MKLDKTQINALANKIAREINEIKTADYNKLVDAKVIELQDKLDHDFAVLEATLSKLPIKTDIRVMIESPAGSTSYNKGNRVSVHAARQFFTLKTLSTDQVREDLILETIEDHQTLESLINKIKNKYVTN